MLCYNIIKVKENKIKQKEKEKTKMTKGQIEAKRAYEQDLIKQGIDKETAEVMASVFIEYDIIKPVVDTLK